MKIKKWFLRFAFLCVILSCMFVGLSAMADSTPITMALTLASGDFTSVIQTLLVNAVTKFPIVATIIFVLGTLRLVMKPAMTAIDSYVKNKGTPAEYAELTNFEASKPYTWACFILDYIASIKLPVLSAVHTTASTPTVVSVDAVPALPVPPVGVAVATPAGTAVAAKIASLVLLCLGIGSLVGCASKPLPGTTTPPPFLAVTNGHVYINGNSLGTINAVTNDITKGVSFGANALATKYPSSVKVINDVNAVFSEAIDSGHLMPSDIQLALNTAGLKLTGLDLALFNELSPLVLGAYNTYVAPLANNALDKATWVVPALHAIQAGLSTVPQPSTTYWRGDGTWSVPFNGIAVSVMPINTPGLPLTGDAAYSYDLLHRDYGTIPK